MARKKAPGALVYVEAPIFVSVIKKEHPHWGDCYKLLLAAERKDIRLVASTLLPVEAFGWHGSTTKSERDKVREYFDRLDVEWVEVDQTIVRETLALSEQFHIHGKDAVHVASAIRAGASHFVTRDDRILRHQVIRGVEIKPPPCMIWEQTTDDGLIDVEVEEADRKLAAEAAAKTKAATAAAKKAAARDGEATPARKS